MSSPLQDVIAQAARACPQPKAAPAGKMMASLRLEEIGDNYRREFSNFNRALHALGRIQRAHYGRVLDGTRPWVARITGRSKKHGLEREFLRGLRDYHEANGCGSRGIWTYYMLPEGVYEVHELVSWSKDRRYFVRSEAGKIVEIGREEAEEWLSSPVSQIDNQ